MIRLTSQNLSDDIQGQMTLSRLDKYLLLSVIYCYWHNKFNPDHQLIPPSIMDQSEMELFKKRVGQFSLDDQEMKIVDAGQNIDRKDSIIRPTLKPKS